MVRVRVTHLSLLAVEGLHCNELKPRLLNEDAQGHPLRQQLTPKSPEQALVFNELGVRLRWSKQCSMRPFPPFSNLCIAELHAGSLGWRQRQRTYSPASGRRSGIAVETSQELTHWRKKAGMQNYGQNLNLLILTDFRQKPVLTAVHNPGQI